MFPDGSMTRHSIAGKVHRLGIGNGVRRGPVSYPSMRQSPKGRIGARLRPAVELRVITAPDPQHQCTLTQLGSMPGILQCRAPIGEPGTEEFRYCGSPDATLPGPYCPYHQKLFHMGRRRRTSPSAILFINPSRSVRPNYYE
jgi:GcrA cell cycle regulator